MARSPIFYDTGYTGLLFDAQTTAATSKAIRIGDYRNQAFSMYVAGTPTVTVKVKVSSQATLPDFSSAVSATNRWAYADIAKSNDAGNITDGDTGYVISSAGAFEFEINQNCYIWAALEISSISGAEAAVTASLALTNNE